MASTLLFMLVSAIDFIAFTLALAAEQMKSTATVVVDPGFNYNYCVYDSNLATSLGIAASVLLLVSQVLTNWESQFCSFGKKLTAERSKACSAALAVICWITFFLAEACLLYGSVKNAQRTKYRTIFMDPIYCQTLSKGVFEGGAILIMITSILSKMNSTCHSEPTAKSFETDSNELGAYASI